MYYYFCIHSWVWSNHLLLICLRVLKKRFLFNSVLLVCFQYHQSQDWIYYLENWTGFVFKYFFIGIFIYFLVSKKIIWKYICKYDLVAMVTKVWVFVFSLCMEIADTCCWRFGAWLCGLGVWVSEWALPHRCCERVGMVGMVVLMFMYLSKACICLLCEMKVHGAL